MIMWKSCSRDGPLTPSHVNNKCRNPRMKITIKGPKACVGVNVKWTVSLKVNTIEIPIRSAPESYLNIFH